MPRLLHILTRPEDPLARESVCTHEAKPDLEIEVVDLTVPRPDYDRLVERVFAADAVVVW